MTSRFHKLRRALGMIAAAAALVTAGFYCNRASAGAHDAVALPSPAVDVPRAAKPGKQTVVFAGGCFWGVQAVFQHVRGVVDATSGYAGGAAETAKYPLVSTGETGHAESVRVTFDPAQVTIGQLLKVFFSVAHDPTELNHQGADEGTQYRSAVFFTTPDEKRVADAYVAQLDRAKVFGDKIVTQVVPLPAFYPAEAYHQDYFARHPDEPYIKFVDAPKVAHLRQLFPDLYRGQQ
ncbi:MAG TPA: peptide-methionine (S)-S-oxide reductase MsrA [Polyangia bacterium]|nr:peptide-methionine (S)-S-oxide reductase MsrA [Polyangia bacterium]